MYHENGLLFFREVSVLKQHRVIFLFLSGVPTPMVSPSETLTA